MDKRYKPLTPAQQMALKDKLMDNLRTGSLSIAQATVAMRKMVRATQSEYAKRVGISLETLRNIEQGKGNPSIDSVNAIGSIFGLELKFTKKKGFPDYAKMYYSLKSRLDALKGVID